MDEVVSRARASKPVLSRAWVVAETVEIMRREGLQAATMRRVAQALGTSASALYVYVASTTELHAAVLDSLTASVRPRGEGGWEQRVRRLLGDYRDLLLTHPGLARSALALRPSGPSTLAFLDALLGLLREGGLPDDRAAWTVDLLVLYTTALAAEHGAAPADDPVAAGSRAGEELFSSVAGADPGRHPNLAQAGPALLGGTPEQRWDWALTVLLAGGGQTPVPDPTTTPGGAR